MLAAAESFEFEDEPDAGDDVLGTLNQSRSGGTASAGREHVINDEYSAAWRQLAWVHFEGGGSVFEGVVLGENLTGQLAGLADGDERNVLCVGESRCEEESARLNTGDCVELATESSREVIDYRCESIRIGKDRGEVTKHDPRLRKVGDRVTQLKNEL